MSGLRMQLQPKGTNYLKDCVEAGATLPGKSLVETFAGETSVSGHLGHAFGTGNISKSLSDKGSITIRFF